MKTISKEMYPLLTRKIAWDVLPHNEVLSFLPALDLVPPSEEGLEMEHRDSHHRVDRLAPLEHHIAVLSALTARVSAAHALKMNLGEIPSEDIQLMVVSQFAETGHITASIVLANLLEQGIISVNTEALA